MDIIELQLIKHLISDNEFYNKTASVLKPNMFQDISCYNIFKFIKFFTEKYNKIPNLSEIAVQIKNIPNKELREQITQTLIEIKNTELMDKRFLLDETVNFAKDRLFEEALLIGSDYLDSKDEKFKEKSRALMDEMQKVSVDNDLGHNYDSIDERIDYYQNPEKGIKYTRFNELNKRLGEGFLPGTLNLFMAPPGIGKSLMISTSITDFVKQKKNVLLISMEMSIMQFVKRIDADLLDININSLKEIDKDIILKKYNELKDSLGKFYTKQYPAGSFSANNLRALLDMYKTQNIEFDLVFLDYLGIMKSDRVSMSSGLYTYGKSIVEEVRAVAVEYNVPIISCNQLNRSATNNIESDNSMVSDSMGVVQTADWICFLLQNEKMKQEKALVFKITKNRYNGRTDFFEMNVNYDNMRVLDKINTSVERDKEISALINTEIEQKSLHKNPIDEWNLS